MREKTKLIHAGRDPFSHFGVLNPPVYHASTMLFENLAALQDKSDRVASRLRYGLLGTPTMLACEEAICALESADHARLLPSGLASIGLVLMAFAKQGHHIWVADNCYEPTRLMSNGLFKRLGIDIRYFDPTIGAGIEALIDDKTSLVLLESPGSLTFELHDIPAIVEVCKAKNVPTAIDSTWGAGVYLKPLEMGVDIALQAGTKYISGNSDLLIGTVAYKEGPYAIPLHETWAQMGSAAAPDALFSTMRGLRSLHVRLDYHYKAGLEIANWLSAHPLVEKILHPALPSHPQHDIWKRDFTGASGLFSFILKGEKNHKKLTQMVDPMRYFKMGFSWGGYESLITPFDPTSMRTASRWPYKGEAIRIHVGQEDIEDLKQDLSDALTRFEKA